MRTPTNRRPDRVAHAIREEVATFLAEQVRDPRVSGLVTVTDAEITRDLRRATVYVSILGGEADRSTTMAGLASLATHLRGTLGRALRLRVAPEIAFVYDDSVARASRIDHLLTQARGATPPADDPPGD